MKIVGFKASTPVKMIHLHLPDRCPAILNHTIPVLSPFSRPRIAPPPSPLCFTLQIRADLHVSNLFWLPASLECLHPLCSSPFRPVQECSLAQTLSFERLARVHAFADANEIFEAKLHQSFPDNQLCRRGQTPSSDGYQNGDEIDFKAPPSPFAPKDAVFVHCQVVSISCIIFCTE